MPDACRHQCSVYDGSPSKSLPGLATTICRHLNEQYRCLYLHNSAMVTEMRSLLLSGGIDVTRLVTQGDLVLLSASDHLLDGQFHIERMVGMLRNAVNQALKDGYRGFFVTGDMSWEFGLEKDFSKLVEYEWQLEDLFREQPALSGICQYHVDTLPAEVLRQGLATHPSLYINATLSKLNPHYVKPEAFTPEACNTPALDAAIWDLCKMPDALMLRALPPGYLL